MSGKPGLILDLDGTLVDSLPGISAALNHTLGVAGLPPHPQDAVRGFIGNGSRVLVERAAPAGSDESLLAELEAAFKDAYRSRWRDGTAPFTGVVPLLGELRSAGFPLGVLSNKPHDFTLGMVEALFPQTFTHILGHRPGAALKPDPAGAIELAAALGREAENCFLIGDSTMDIETARRAGMRPIGVTWGYHDRPPLVAAGADVLIESVAELRDFLLEKAAVV